MARDGSPLTAETRALRIALVANGAFAAVEVIAGIAFGSLALLADAGHMLVDVGALFVALVAQRLVARPATARHTYGMQRAEVLAALGNGVLVLVLAGFLTAEAVDRLRSPTEVVGSGLLAVATVGLMVNLVSAWVIARTQSRTLNMRGALVHMLGDAAGSVAAIVAGLAVVLAAANWVDAAATLVIVALLVWAAWGLVRDAVQVLMEATPRGMDPSDVEHALAVDPDVEAVHHLHVWNLGSDTAALSAHVRLRGEVTLHEAQVRGDRLKAMLTERFGIEHSTLELECHPCAPEREQRASEQATRH